MDDSRDDAVPTDEAAPTDRPTVDEPAADEPTPEPTTGTSDAAPPADATTPAGPSRSRRSWLLVALAALVAVSGLVGWQLSSGDDALALAERRDTVLVEGRQAIEIMNSLDYRDVDAGIEAWQSVTTGTLSDQLAAVGDSERKLLAEQEKISEGRVVDAAVLEIDDDSATVLASVEVSVVDDAQEDSPTSVKRNRFSADLILVDGDWLLESLQQVAVNL